MSTPEERAAALVAQLTPEEKLRCLSGDGPFWAGLTYLGEGGYHKSPFRALQIERLGIAGFAFSDGPRGVVIDQATCFPVAMARGASWDLQLEERIGEVIGTELRAVGADLFGGVCVNLLRHPAWGRAQETYGEDPLHVGMFGAALVRGVQRHAMATVKHFACNSMENARFSVDVTVDEVALHEIFLPHFRRIVDAGVAAVMSAYNSVNGEWCGQNYELLTGILRHEWGFSGFVISDWIFGVRDAGLSVHAGLDVEMPHGMVRATHLAEDLEAGRATWAEVDRAIEHVLTTCARFADVLDRPIPDRSVLAAPAHRALAREAAAASVVLLKNQPIASSPGSVPLLPLALTSGQRLAVVGRLADLVNLGDGGSSDVWAPQVTTIAAGLEAALGADAVRHDDGSDVARAAEVAQSADVAVVVVGYTRDDEGEFMGEGTWSELAHLFPGPDDPEEVERFAAQIADERLIGPPEHVLARAGAEIFSQGGDRRSLRLRDSDVALIRAVVAAQPAVVVLVVAGSAVVASEWESSVPAVAQVFYSGMEGGHGIADVLVGNVDASGRLPFTVPKDESDLCAFDPDARSCVYDEWHGYWRHAELGLTPAHPFGFGLSYTTWSYGAPSIEETESGWRVSVEVANTGTRDGSDVVQVYGRHDDGGRPERLVGFTKVHVAQGATTVATVEVERVALGIRDVDRHAMVLRPGTYVLRIGRHVLDPGGEVRLIVDELRLV